jgi:hypothetical protein
MKLWSRGLGKTEIYMDFRHYKTYKDPKTGNVLIIGSMQSPVTWEFKITLQPEDIAGVMKAAVNPSMIWFVLKSLPQCFIYLFNRKKFRSEKDIVQKVNSTYEQIMSGGRTRPTGLGSSVSSSNTSSNGPVSMSAARSAAVEG